MQFTTITTEIGPEGRLEILSKAEVAKLLDTGHGGLYNLFRKCSLAVLNSGNELDDGKQLLDRYRSFDISIMLRERGIKLKLKDAPGVAFVDGQMIQGIREHLFAVVRDIIYASNEIYGSSELDLNNPQHITDSVFQILRNADVLKPQRAPNLVVCWGGHSIRQPEYDYAKHVGYEMGLRGLDICTGSGPGAMKAPMKGAAIGHAKQRNTASRFIGMSEPGIIAAESPNPIVNNLVIFPDIEKRLEGFVRTGHGIVVFPGGAGTAEEILYLLGILLHPENAGLPYPLLLTGPASAASYFEMIDRFIGFTLGPTAQARYKIIVDDPVSVAREMQDGVRTVREFRKEKGDAYYFNWLLKIDPAFQRPFLPTHENMNRLDLRRNQPVHLLAANLRRAFSGIVAGNVKEDGINEIAQHGPFEIRGDADIMAALDTLLGAFVEQQRMKLPGKAYIPCYRVVAD